MKQTVSHTALVLFSRTPNAEAAAKNFTTGKRVKQNKIIAKAFYQRAIKVANQTKLPLYVVDEKEQHGELFGEKLSNAIESVFLKGYQKVIVIGNDCLQLNSDVIHHAADALNYNDIVIAPTSKGGISLLGITKTSFNKNSFEAIPWQTSDVYASLTELSASHADNVLHLPCLEDVNDYHDLITEASQLSFSDKFRLLIISSFASLKHRFGIFINFSSYKVNYLAGLRAPPSA